MKQYSSHLKQLTRKVWTTKKQPLSKASYPVSGHSNCYSIEDKSFWFRHRNDSIISILKNYPPSGTIFDIGGGNGFVASALIKNNFPTVVIEPGVDGVKNASKRNIQNIIHSTFEEIHFRKNSVCAFGLFDVLEHIQKDEEFLKNIFKTLKPGGRLYITIPAYSFLWSDQDIYAHHFRRYTKLSISRLLKRRGFSLDYVSYYFMLFPIPIFLLRSIPYLMHLTKEYTETQFRKEMTSSFQIFTPFIKKYLQYELRSVQGKTTLPFGSSILVVASKPL